MSGSSIALEQAVLGHTLGFSPMPLTIQVYVALILSVGPSSETVAGTEVSGGGYTRMPATFELLSPAAGSVAANTTTIEFPMAAADWGTVGYFELWDAPSGGNRLYWGQLLNPVDGVTPITQHVLSGDIMRFSAGSLGVQAVSSATLVAPPGVYVPLTGGSMTGPLLLSGNATAVLGAVPLQQLNAAPFLPLTGGTVTGALTLGAALTFQAMPANAANDAAAATAGVPVGGVYRNGSVLQVRVS